jgi:methyl-accepting chemotaxis protein
MLAHPKDKSLLLKEDAVLPFVKDIVRLKNGHMDYVFNGEAKLAAYHQLPSTGWIVAASTTEAEMLVGAIRARTIISLVGAGVCLLLAVVIFLVIRGMVVKPAGHPALRPGDLRRRLRHHARRPLHLRAADLAANIRAMKEKIKQEMSFAKGVLGGFTLPCCGATPPAR